MASQIVWLANITDKNTKSNKISLITIFKYHYSNIIMKQNVKRKLKLKVTFKYSKKIAIRFNDTRYYDAIGSEYKNLLYKEKRKYANQQPRLEKISEIIEKF